jgi:hypothetical protein
MNAAREAQLEGSIKTAGSQTTPGTWKKPRERTRPASWSNPDVPPTWRAMQNLGEFYRASKRSGTVLLPEGWAAEWDEQVREGEAGQRNGEKDWYAT